MKWLRSIHLASIHLASVGTFGGALALLVLGSTVDAMSPTGFAAVRQAMTIALQRSVWRPRLGGRAIAGRGTRPATR
jgi:hypothetical protein